MPGPVVETVRRLCLALPGATEKVTHGSPGFFAGRQFVMLWPDGHHDHRFPHLWCAAAPGTQEGLVSLRPERFFRPPYVGGRGWVGVRLDRRPSLAELASIIEDAYRCVAPKRLLAALDEERAGGRARRPLP